MSTRQTSLNSTAKVEVAAPLRQVAPTAVRRSQAAGVVAPGATTDDPIGRRSLWPKRILFDRVDRSGDLVLENGWRHRRGPVTMVVRQQRGPMSWTFARLHMRSASRCHGRHRVSLVSLSPSTIVHGKDIVSSGNSGAGTFLGVDVSASVYEFPPQNEPDPGAWALTWATPASYPLSAKFEVGDGSGESGRI